MREKVIEAVLPRAGLLDAKTKIYVNPTGLFIVGGPNGDTGLTGRKISSTATAGGRATEAVHFRARILRRLIAALPTLRVMSPRIWLQPASLANVKFNWPTPSALLNPFQCWWTRLELAK